MSKVTTPDQTKLPDVKSELLAFIKARTKKKTRCSMCLVPDEVRKVVDELILSGEISNPAAIEYLKSKGHKVTVGSLKYHHEVKHGRDGD